VTDTTPHQSPDRSQTGRLGEEAVVRHVACPQCGKRKLTRLVEPGFPCVDIICKFCGFLAQVKSTTATLSDRPTRALGANWAPQKEQILRDIFHALYVVSIVEGEAERIWYIPAHMLRVNPAAFKPGSVTRDGRNRRRQTFSYDLGVIPDIGIERVHPPEDADD
jgi:type II restriction enzyme